MTLALAPLAGFTDAPFRRMCAEGGADLSYTEMVSAAGLAHGSSPTRHLMEVMPGEGPVACQIFGASESDVAYATDFIQRNCVETVHPSSLVPHPFVEINLNAGCPMTKVTREGAGAKLIEDPDRICRLVRAMTENTSLPVTVKTRIGPHPKRTNAFELLDAAERGGAMGLIVHARYTSQMHGGEVHLDVLRELVGRAHVPITGNGSVVDAKTAAAMAATGVSAVMVGRAALSDPAIFSRLKGDAKTEGAAGASPFAMRLRLFRRHLAYLLQFREQLASRFPNDHVPSVDGFASVKMHVHLFRYFNGLPGAAALRARLNSVRTLEEINAIVGTLGNCYNNMNEHEGDFPDGRDGAGDRGRRGGVAEP